MARIGVDSGCLNMETAKHRLFKAVEHWECEVGRSGWWRDRTASSAVAAAMPQKGHLRRRIVVRCLEDSANY